MIWLVYDGSFEGLLTTIFETYDRKLEQVHIRKDTNPIQDLFADVETVITDEIKAERVWKKLISILKSTGLRTIWKAWLSEDEKMEDIILEIVRYAIRTKQNVLKDYTNSSVVELQKAVKSVDREKHRMEAFIRFQLTKDEIYFSVIEPDFNVLPLILSHFKNRYADQRWFVYDSRRLYGIYYDLKKAEFVDFMPNELLSHKGIAPEAFGENESLYQNLWKDYFKSTNIAGRKNAKLHIQHVPKRYWKYLVEKQSLLD